MKSPREIEAGLANIIARGNKEAVPYLKKLQACDNEGDKLAVIEDMKDDALRYHRDMIELAKYLERKYLPNERQTWNLK